MCTLFLLFSDLYLPFNLLIGRGLGCTSSLIVYWVNLVGFAFSDCEKQCLKFKALMNKYQSCMMDTVGEVNIFNGKARLCMMARLSFALARPRLKNVLHAILRRLGS